MLHREEGTGRGFDEAAQWVQVAERIADAFIDALPGIRRALIRTIRQRSMAIRSREPRRGDPRPAGCWP